METYTSIMEAISLTGLTVSLGYYAYWWCKRRIERHYRDKIQKYVNRHMVDMLQMVIEGVGKWDFENDEGLDDDDKKLMRLHNKLKELVKSEEIEDTKKKELIPK